MFIPGNGIGMERENMVVNRFHKITLWGITELDPMGQYMFVWNSMDIDGKLNCSCYGSMSNLVYRPRSEDAH